MQSNSEEGEDIARLFEPNTPSKKSKSMVGEASQVVRICNNLEKKMSNWRTKLRKAPSTSSSTPSSCCIYTVPQRLRLINGTNYKPRIVSIGPYSWNDSKLKKNIGFKWQCLDSMLSRTRAKGLTLGDYVKEIEPLETMARQCYSGQIDPKCPFLKTMVVDGCFILELFRKYDKPRLLKPDDPLAMKVPYLYENLLLLECQIPFFVLQKLFEISKMPDEENGPSLSLLALRFFNNAMGRPEAAVNRCANFIGLHLLDLVRLSLIPIDLVPPNNEGNTQAQLFPCVSKLRRAGIEVGPGKADTFLAVKFEHGVIEMPTITMSDFMKLLLRNCVAFEHCHGHKSSPKYFTVYATFLDCLVTTPEDVKYLRQRDVIDNYLDSDGDIADVINQLGKEVAFDTHDYYLSKLFNDVKNYYENECHVQWASFKNTYFNSPWSFISALAAFVLLLFTLAQTFFAVISYVHPK